MNAVCANKQNNVVNVAAWINRRQANHVCGVMKLMGRDYLMPALRKGEQCMHCGEKK